MRNCGPAPRRSDRRLITAAAVSSIDRRVTSITGQAQRVQTHLDELGMDRVAIDIKGLAVFVQRQQTAAADLGDSLSTGEQADHHRAIKLEKLGRRLESRDQQDVGGANAAVGEIDAGRRLGGPADADQHDLGLVEILRMLAVIVQHRVVERFDALEIMRIEDVLAANMGPRLGLEIGGESRDHRIENRQAGVPRVLKRLSSRPRKVRSAMVKSTMPGWRSTSSMTRCELLAVRTRA